jgi:hypothetical protein
MHRRVTSHGSGSSDCRHACAHAFVVVLVLVVVIVRCGGGSRWSHCWGGCCRGRGRGCGEVGGVGGMGGCDGHGEVVRAAAGAQ